MEKSLVIHDLAVAAAVISVSHNYNSEIMSEKPANRRAQIADCIMDEYKWYNDYFQESIK